MCTLNNNYKKIFATYYHKKLVIQHKLNKYSNVFSV